MALRVADTVSVPANSVSANVLAGTELERMPITAKLDIALNGDSTTGLRATLIVGTQVVLDDVLLNVNNRIPIFPDDFLDDAIPMKGDLVILRFRNTTAGALDAFWSLKASPV